jgi:Ca-activated chloride channel homolog
MFQYPAFIAAIPWVTGVFVILYVISRRKRRQRIAKLSQQLASDLQGNHCRIRSRIKANFVAAGVVFILVALARPQAGFEWREVRSDRQHLLFVLDVSKSMLVADVYPNRLERAKWLIREIVESDPRYPHGFAGICGRFVSTDPDHSGPQGLVGCARRSDGPDDLHSG